jgi:hypothetical protein
MLIVITVKNGVDAVDLDCISEKEDALTCGSDIFKKC